MEILLQNKDYRTILSCDPFDVAVYDPPFDIWESIDYKIDAKTYICFTNFKNRHHVEKLFGRPKVELIWYFEDGRWVSHKLPRQTHEYILIYGDIKNECYVGEKNKLQSVKKGSGCIGRDKNLGTRIYNPRESKMINSVISIPRNLNKDLGTWSKPEKLIKILLMWLCVPGDMVWDGFAGSGTVAVVCSDLGVSYYGTEIDFNTFTTAKRRIETKQKQLKLL